MKIAKKITKIDRTVDETSRKWHVYYDQGTASATWSLSPQRRSAAANTVPLAKSRLCDNTCISLT